MIAYMSGVTDYAAATSFMSTYTFGGMAVLSCIFLGVSYFAVNDSNLFGSTYACENIKQLPHRLCVCIIAIVGAIVGAILALTGTAKSLETIACLNAVILPTPTIIMLCEWALFHFEFKNPGKFGERIPDFGELPTVRPAATIALLTGITFGLLTSGIIPGTESLKVGIASVQTWLVCAIVYLPLRVIEYRKEMRTQLDGLEHLFAMDLHAFLSVPSPSTPQAIITPSSPEDSILMRTQSVESTAQSTSQSTSTHRHSRVNTNTSKSPG
jgi:purine-cytosine permease-like protein